jgi:hypothetical protein
MKATMSRNGVITLSPETDCEAFALTHWAAEAAVPQDDVMRCETFKWRSTSLVIDLTVKVAP